MVTNFGQLKSGDSFQYGGKMWIKVKSKNSGFWCKACGSLNYNAHLSGNRSVTKTFKPQDKVTV